MDGFQYTNLAEMFFWSPFTKMVKAIMPWQKTWPLAGLRYLIAYLYKKK